MYGIESYICLNKCNLARYKEGNEWAKFDFSVTPSIGCAMEYVNVKYSTQYNRYTYLKGEGDSDTCLRVDNDTCKGISHVTFCPRSITDLSIEPSFAPKIPSAEPSDITKVIKKNVETSAFPSSVPSDVVSKKCKQILLFD